MLRALLTCTNSAKTRISYSSTCKPVLTAMAKGLLLPVRPDGSIFSSEKSISSHLKLDGSDIAAVWKASSAKGRPGEIRILYGQGNAKDTTIALVCTGNVEKLSANELRERSRIIAATGVKALREAGCTEVTIPITGINHPVYANTISAGRDHYHC